MGLVQPPEQAEAVDEHLRVVLESVRVAVLLGLRRFRLVLLRNARFLRLVC